MSKHYGKPGEAFSRVVPVLENSQVGEARRYAVTLAESVGFNQTDSGKVGILVTEAGSNLVKHGGGGEIILRALRGSGPGMEILAIDKGPGIADLAACMRDGYSTAGSPGHGLGAMQRLASFFDSYSSPGLGTVILMRVAPEPRPGNPRPSPDTEAGVICACHPNEEVSGDAWEWAQDGDRGRIQLLLVDGLGHGQYAAQAAMESARIFCASLDQTLEIIVQRAHQALRSTRGAALAVGELDAYRHTFRFAGVGNISGRVLDGETERNMVSHNGTVGHQLSRIQEFGYDCPAGALVVLHSDGLQTRWTLAGYPGLRARHPAVIAGILYRDFQRGRDDVTVMVLRG